MKPSRFASLTNEEFKQISPREESEVEAYEFETEFRNYCQTHELDPLEEAAREEFQEVHDEINGFWDNLDDDERDGWNDMITKSFD